MEVPKEYISVSDNLNKIESGKVRKKFDEIIYLEDIKRRYQMAIEKKSNAVEGFDEQFLTKGKQEIFEQFDIQQEFLVKQAVAANAVTNARFNAEAYSIWNKKISSLDTDSATDENDNLMTFLENQGKSIEYASKISEQLKEQRQLNKKILHLKKKYSDLLKSIKYSWAVLEERVEPDTDDEPDNVKKLRGKLENRETRMRVIVNLLQILISSSGNVWGANDRCVKCLRLCDAILTRDAQNIFNLQAELQASRNRLLRKNIPTFTTSTPIRDA